MDLPETRKLMEALDLRPVDKHLTNLECALCSELEPVNQETKLECIDIVKKNVEIICCDELFDELRAIVRDEPWGRAQSLKCQEIVSTLRAIANSLLC